MFNLLHDPFLQMAFLASLLASLASGTIGSFVVVKRIVFIAGSISHSILAGLGLCLWLQRVQGISWADPIVGAFLSAIASALLIGWIHLNHRQREDSVIAATWSTGMAIGVVFLALTPGNNAEILDYLFGNILWITPHDLLLLGMLNGVLLTLLALNYRKFVALCLDEEQALLQGIPVKRLYILLLTMVAATIVFLVQVIGIVLVIALLAVPATLANLFTHRLPSMMLLATLLCAILSAGGLSASYALDWPPGATISLLTALAYLVGLALKRKIFRWFQTPSRSI